MIPTIRIAFFWAHLALGVAAGLIILWLAGTGFVLALEEPVIGWLERPLQKVEVAAQALPLTRLAGLAAAEGRGERVSGIRLDRDPASTVKVSLGRTQSLYLDPHNGKVLGRGAERARAWFHWVEDLHRNFGFEGKARERTRQVKAAANGAFLLILLSGIFLWWPRGRTAPLWRFKRGLRGKGRDYHWHNVFGLWAWLPLMLISLTGLVMSYSWANKLLYRAAGEAPPPARAAAASPDERRQPAQGTGRRGGRPNGREGGADRDGSRRIDWDALAAAAKAQVPAWRSLSLRAPRPGQDTVIATVITSGAAPPRGRGVLTLRVADASLVRWEPYEAQSAGRKLRSWARWTHTGQSLGAGGQALMALACLCALVLVCTGLALSWRRFIGRGKPSA